MGDPVSCVAWPKKKKLVLLVNLPLAPFYPFHPPNLLLSIPSTQDSPGGLPGFESYSLAHFTSSFHQSCPTLCSSLSVDRGTNGGSDKLILSIPYPAKGSALSGPVMPWARSVMLKPQGLVAAESPHGGQLNAPVAAEIRADPATLTLVLKASDDFLPNPLGPSGARSSLKFCSPYPSSSDFRGASEHLSQAPLNRAVWGL